MPLTEVAIRNAKATGKPFKLFDEKGLFLLVSPNGSKAWRFKYRFEGKEKLLSFGVYPEVGLKEARAKRDEARLALRDNQDPSGQRKAAKAAAYEAEHGNFEGIAREWFSKFSTAWVESHSREIMRRLEKDVFPYMPKKPIKEVTAPEPLSILRDVERRGVLETARRIRQYFGQIFRYAISIGVAEVDPSAALPGLLRQSRTNTLPVSQSLKP